MRWKEDSEGFGTEEVSERFAAIKLIKGKSKREEGSKHTIEAILEMFKHCNKTEMIKKGSLQTKMERNQ